MSNVKIVIIGSGAAGIATASRLYKNGFNNITILEAENRIGGRINTIEFGKGVIELGAQWCHGEKGNIVYDMVKDLNILKTSLSHYKYMSFYESNGKMIDKNITDKLVNINQEIIEDEEELKKHRDGCFGEFFINR